MKLEKTKKYANIITKGLSSILLTSILLTGMNMSVDASDDYKKPIEDAQSINDDNVVKKDENYFMNYKEVTAEEKERRLECLDIKYPNIIHRTMYVNTLVVKDDDKYKIIPVIDIYNVVDNRMEVYDLFTEEKLFDVNESYDDYYFNISCINNELFGHKFDAITNAIPYFDGKQICEYGVSCYTATFFQKHLDDFRQKDGINYKFDVNYVYSYLYTLPFRTNDCFFTTYELADNYVTTVPNEFRVTSEELGLKSTYRDEDKYYDFWKENETNLDKRLSDFEVIYPEEVINGGTAQTLVFKDSLGNYKLMNVTMLVKDNKMYVDDLFTGIDLFTANMTGNLDYELNSNEVHQFTGIDFTTLYDAIPYFEDKTIVKLDMCTEVSRFVYEHFDELRNRDGIDYKYPELSYFYYLFPLKFEYSDEINLTREEYARNYLVSVPEEMQVHSKDLRIGLDETK